MKTVKLNNLTLKKNGTPIELMGVTNEVEVSVPTEVQINGASITQEVDGKTVANIPNSSTTKYGVMQIADNSVIDSRKSSKVIDVNHMDYAVKCAMTDGKGNEWTSEEKESAQERIGVKGFATIESVASMIAEKLGEIENGSY